MVGHTAWTPGCAAGSPATCMRTHVARCQSFTAPTAVAGRCKRPCGCVTVSSAVPHRDDGVNSELPEVPVETCPVLSMQGAVQGILCATDGADPASSKKSWCRLTIPFNLHCSPVPAGRCGRRCAPSCLQMMAPTQRLPQTLIWGACSGCRGRVSFRQQPPWQATWLCR